MQQKPDAKAVHRQKGIQPSAASNDTGREGFRTWISFGFNFFSCGKLAIRALVLLWGMVFICCQTSLFLAWHEFGVCFTGIILRCTHWCRYNCPAPRSVQQKREWNNPAGICFFQGGRKSMRHELIQSSSFPPDRGFSPNPFCMKEEKFCRVHMDHHVTSTEAQWFR